jgi:mannosyl-oligosaccharide alpha-1,3-glucosidase
VISGWQGRAEGLLYMDDEHTLLHTQGQYVARRFMMEKNVLRNEVFKGQPGTFKNLVERVAVLGYSSRPASVMVHAEGSMRTLEYSYDGNSKVLIIRKPDVLADGDWSINVN